MTVSRHLMDDVAAWADGWLRHRQRTLQLPGVQFAIAHDGEVIASGAHGVADLETGEPLRTDHLFHIASHSKTFTATALLRLAEDPDSGLRLDDRLDAHLRAARTGALADLGGRTVADLLAHGSGISRDGADGDYWLGTQPFPDAAALEALCERTAPPYEANERFHYSNLAYALLGLVIEAVTGRGYGEHVEAAIVTPLGLEHTVPEYLAADAPRYATGHSSTQDGRARHGIDHLATSALAPATGFGSTASDLARYFGAHCLGDERLLSDAAKRRMQRPVWTQHEGEHYGLGLQVLDLGRRRLVGHSGGYPGHITRTWCDPVDGIVVAICCNSIDGPATEWCNGIFRLLDHVARRDEGLGTHAAGVDPRSYCGRYSNLWTAYDIAAFGDRLVVIPLVSNNPLDGLGELVVETGWQARLARARDGYQSEGEPFTVERDRRGVVTKVRGFSGMTALPDGR